MANLTQLEVTSHVGRDLLASAASFKSEAAAVWEYVVNSLQYVDDGVLPKVQIVIKPRAKLVTIQDNGRGMDAEGLRQYFTMHGENIERIRGIPGRGKFGTGKSAAFGIANFLCIDTRRNGVRNVVELTREAISSSDGGAVKLDWKVKNERTDALNGTLVVIKNMIIRRLSAEPVIEYIERNLQVFRTLRPEVAVNDHLCQYREPSIDSEFVFKPSQEQTKLLGEVELAVKVSTTPLPASECGISITAGLGNLVAVETAGIDKKEMGNYLFGEIDVPNLEKWASDIEPYDPTRSLQLNIQHPVVRVLLPFIGSKLDEIRKQEVKKLQEIRKSEDARRLATQADKIAALLNQDFETQVSRLSDIRAASSSSGPARSRFGKGLDGGDEEGVWLEGVAIPGTLEETEIGELSPEPPQPTPPTPVPYVPPSGDPDEEGTSSLDPADGNTKKRRRPKGGFKVDYRGLGEDRDRSFYDKATLTILINLDHPAVKNALNITGIDDPSFKRLSYEIAFTEYAVNAYASALVDKDPDIPADDLLYDVRRTLNRLARSAAHLYLVSSMRASK